MELTQSDELGGDSPDPTALAVSVEWIRPLVAAVAVGTAQRALDYATETAAMTTRDAVQVLGGHGFLVDHPVELWHRSAAALAVLDFDPLCSAFAAAV